MITKEGFTQLNITHVRIQTHIPKVIEIFLSFQINQKLFKFQKHFFLLTNNHLHSSCEFNEINARIKIDRVMRSFFFPLNMNTKSLKSMTGMNIKIYKKFLLLLYTLAIA